MKLHGGLSRQSNYLHYNYNNPLRIPAGRILIIPMEYLALSEKCYNFAAFMKKGMGKFYNIGMLVLVGIGVFLFWYIGYPHALSYQEQYQLFLWTGDYFWERVSLPGGFADWLGEFIVQFYYVEWLGALLLALLFVALQSLTARLLPEKWLLLSLMPVALVLWLMGDINVLLSFPVAIVLALSLTCIQIGRASCRERV